MTITSALMVAILALCGPVNGRSVDGRTVAGEAVKVAPQTGNITLGWDPTPGEKISGYLVGYAQIAADAKACPTNGDGDTFVPVTPPTATTFKVTKLTPGKTYCFRVYALNTNGRSNASNTVGPHAIPGPPTPPADLAPRAAPSSAVRINFGPASGPPPAGFLLDSGAVFGDRGNGRSYGWNVDASRATRDRDPSHPDDTGKTLIHMQREADGVPDGVWELAVPNGSYEVQICAGDPNYIDSTYSIEVEGVLVLTGTPTGGQHLFEVTKTVTVSDGRLTIRSAKGAVNNKLSWIAVTPKK